jgi:hypothetical protein
MLVLYICFVCKMQEFPFLGSFARIFFSQRAFFVFSAFAAISFKILKTRKL